MAHIRSKDLLPAEYIDTNHAVSISVDGQAGENFHTISLDDLLARLETNSINGLSTDRANQLLKQHGENKLTPPKKPNYF